MLRFRSHRYLLGEDLKISFSQGTDWSLLQLKMLHLVEKHFTGADFLEKNKDIEWSCFDTTRCPRKCGISNNTALVYCHIGML